MVRGSNGIGRWVHLSNFSLFLNIGVVVAGLTALWVIWVFYTPAGGWGKGMVEVEIPPGANLRDIAHLLHQHHLIPNKTSFIWAARLMGKEREIKSGRYAIPLGASNLKVLRVLEKPLAPYERVVIPEGYTIWQVAGVLAQILEIDSAEFINWCYDSAFIRDLGIEAPSLEGYLFPDTYFLHKRSPIPTIISRLVKNFNVKVDSTLRESFSRRGLTLHQAVTLASIVEGEMMNPEEGPLISAVFHNRLRKGIPLEADPTIQYIVPGPPRRLYLSDLEIESPYNTYKYKGLPPGPINNPGLQALRAVAAPAEVDYIYFVAQGDGTHFFTSDYREFLEAKKRLNELRKALSQNEIAARKE